MKDKGRQVALLSLGLNITITLIKYALYLFTGSVALLAETIHSSTDAVCSVLVLASIYMSEKKSERYPWGLYKIEDIASLAVAGMIALSMAGIGRNIFLISSSPEVKHIDSAAAALLIMIIPMLMFSKYEKTMAKRLNSPLLLADAENWKMDIAPLIIVTVGIIGTRFSFPMADKIAAAFIIVLIGRACYDIVKNSVQSLLDASVDNATIDKIKAIVREFQDVKDIISVQARKAGRFIFINLKITVTANSFYNAHKTADNIDRALKEKIPFVENVIVHYEPIDKGYTRNAVLLSSDKTLMSESFGCAPYIALWDIDNKSKAVLAYEVVENPFAKAVSKKGTELIDFLINKGTDILYTKKDLANVSKLGNILSKAGIETKEAQSMSINKLIPYFDMKGGTYYEHY
ncbi:cation diffusion facilitator family transporter [Candidatus Magnetoovum chiemensis]|nr:cation diffusion facilitator family transporter [Candidatus Magnetoovum chiemensis]